MGPYEPYEVKLRREFDRLVYASLGCTPTRYESPQERIERLAKSRAERRSKLPSCLKPLKAR